MEDHFIEERVGKSESRPIFFLQYRIALQDLLLIYLIPYSNTSSIYLLKIFLISPCRFGLRRNEL